MKTNSFIRLRKLSTVRGPVLEIQDMGDAGALLRDTRHLREIGQPLIRGASSPGMMVGTDGWVATRGALRDAVTILKTPSVTKSS